MYRGGRFATERPTFLMPGPVQHRAHASPLAYCARETVLARALEQRATLIVPWCDRGISERARLAANVLDCDRICWPEHSLDGVSIGSHHVCTNRPGLQGSRGSVRSVLTENSLVLARMERKCDEAKLKRSSGG